VAKKRDSPDNGKRAVKEKRYGTSRKHGGPGQSRRLAKCRLNGTGKGKRKTKKNFGRKRLSFKKKSGPSFSMVWAAKVKKVETWWPRRGAREDAKKKNKKRR